MYLFNKLPYNTPFLLYRDLNFEGMEQKIYLEKTKTNHTDNYFLKLKIPQLAGDYCQGYIYFYLNYNNMTSKFIGLYLPPELRGKGLSSLLTSAWIKLCLENGFEMLQTQKKQRKPFLIYLLKKYKFELLEASRYETDPKTIHICKSKEDLTKFLLFEDAKYKEAFKNSKIMTADNYQILEEYDEKFPIVDDVILQTPYFLQDNSAAYTRSNEIIRKYS